MQEMNDFTNKCLLRNKWIRYNEMFKQTNFSIIPETLIMCFTTSSIFVRIKSRITDYQITPVVSKGKNSNHCICIHMIFSLSFKPKKFLII